MIWDMMGYVGIQLDYMGYDGMQWSEMEYGGIRWDMRVTVNLTLRKMFIYSMNVSSSRVGV